MDFSFIIDNSFYQLFYFFVIYSFLGWCLETVFSTIKNHHFVNRGFLYGPFCPMYGFGVALLISTSKPVENNYLLLFFVCFAGASILEYFTGYILETLFNSKWWDYSNSALNIHGRISIIFSIIWGAIGVFIIKLLHPYGVSLLLGMLPVRIGTILLPVIFIYFIIDLSFTLMSLITLKHLLQQLEDVTYDIKRKLVSYKDSISEKVDLFENLPKEIREKYGDIEKLPKEIFNKYNVGDKLMEFLSKREVLLSLPSDLRERYESIIDNIASQYARFFNAFPQFGTRRLKKTFGDIRSKISAKARASLNHNRKH
jgi:uncharacterized membrane protein